MIAGLEAARLGHGRHQRRGSDPDARAQSRGVGFVFQHYAAFKHMTVRDNVAFGLKIRKRPKTRSARARATSCSTWSSSTGSPTAIPRSSPAASASGMALARALAVEPKGPAALDEPFGALDAHVRQDLRAWLRRLHDAVHVTTRSFVTHDQEEAMEVAER